MRLFGLEIRKASPVSATPIPSTSRGWWPLVREPYAGAWQKNQEWSVETVLAHHAVYACVTLIANDIGKLRPKLVEQDADGIWSETKSAAFSPVLRKPNRYQNRIQFAQWWVTSKLMRGNTYVLKERDERGVVVREYILDPSRVTVLVAPDGAIYYELRGDHNDLTGLTGESITVPSREIIHDRMNCLFHPLVGVSPIFASGIAANIGIKIQQNSTGFFANGSNPSGLLSTAVSITPAKSKELSDVWNEQFGGANGGKVAVLGDGMKFEPMRMTAVDSQLIEQLRWTAETVCSTFHVPPWKIGVGSQPAYTKPEIANQAYYSDCLQSLIEEYELCQDEGLGLDEAKDGKVLGVELDVFDGLFRMDEASQLAMLTSASGGAVLTPNEARRRANLGPKTGGNQLWKQQQDHSLQALAERDAAGPPPNIVGDRRTPAAPAPGSPTPPAEPALESQRDLVAAVRKAAKRLVVTVPDAPPPAWWAQRSAPPVNLHVHMPSGTRKTIELVNPRGEVSTATMTED